MPNKKRRCICCKEYFDKEGMYKTPTNPPQWFCSFDHAALYAGNKARKMRQKEQNRAKKARKDKFYANDRGYHSGAAQKAFNTFIREIDKGQPCRSCGQVRQSKLNCGHYRSVGAAPHLRWNIWNAWVQCESCNAGNKKSGNIIEYRKGLVKLIGSEKVEWIENNNTPLKMSVQDIIKLKEYYLRMTRLAKKHNIRRADFIGE